MLPDLQARNYNVSFVLSEDLLMGVDSRVNVPYQEAPGKK